MIIQKIMLALNDKLATYITGGAIGGNTTAITITSFMEKTTPMIIYISSILTAISLFFMCLYWIRKNFKKKTK